MNWRSRAALLNVIRPEYASTALRDHHAARFSDQQRAESDRPRPWRAVGCTDRGRRWALGRGSGAPGPSRHRSINGGLLARARPPDPGARPRLTSSAPGTNEQIQLRGAAAYAQTRGGMRIM